MKIFSRFLTSLVFLTFISSISATERLERVFYFVRHGSTDWGIDRILEGPLDLPLNAKGEGEVATLADIFSCLDNDKPTHILHSPLIRCQGTTNILSVKLNIAETKAFEGLQEVYRGDWRTLSKENKELAARLLGDKKYVELSDISVEDAENWDVFLQRIDAAISQCLIYCQNIPIIVTHGQVVKEFLKKKDCWSGMKWEGDSRLPIKVSIIGDNWSAKVL